MKQVISAAFLLICLAEAGFNLAAEAGGGDLLLAAKDSDIVVFNTRSQKYHIPSCRLCKECKNCIQITRGQAKDRGGKACKTCGAGE